MSVNKVNSDGSTTLIAGATLWADSPIGTILPYGGATAPAGFLLCDGAEKNKADYPELYAVIGDAFGTASVNTKFVLPDLREATTKGAGLTGKSNNHYDSDGVALGEFIDDRLQEHRHQTVLSNAQSGSGQQLADQGSGQSTYATGNVYSSARKGDTTEVKAVGVNYIIKSKQVALPADLESAVEDAVEETVKIDNNSKTKGKASYNFTFNGSGTSTIDLTKFFDESDITSGGRYFWVSINGYSESFGNINVSGRGAQPSLSAENGKITLSTDISAKTMTLSNTVAYNCIGTVTIVLGKL